MKAGFCWQSLSWGILVFSVMVSSGFFKIKSDRKAGLM